MSKEFLNQVLVHFRFLITDYGFLIDTTEHDFQLFDFSACSMQSINHRLSFVLEKGNVYIDLGPIGLQASSSHNAAQSFDLATIMDYYFPRAQIIKRVYQDLSAESNLETKLNLQLGILSNEFRQNADFIFQKFEQASYKKTKSELNDFLKVKFENDYKRMMQGTKFSAESFLADERLAKKVRKEVSKAWKKRDFARVVSLYESIHVKLTPAEMKQFEYAKTQSKLQRS